MSSGDKRYFESDEHVKLYVAARPIVPNHVIQKIVQYLQKHRSNEKLVFAIDVACGSGQSCLPLSDWFVEVHGLDISPGQIKEANLLNHPANITYKVGNAEKLPVPDNSVDLIFCNMAIHWFNRDAFFKEVQRTLKVGGALAVCAFPNAGVEVPLNVPVHTRDRFVKAQETFIQRISPYFDPAIELYMNNYRDIHPLPGLHDPQYIEDMVGQRKSSVQNQFENLLSTSAFQNLKTKDQDQAGRIVEELKCEFVECFGGMETELVLQFSIILLLAHKQ